MAKTRKLQMSLAAGILDPTLAEREDVEAFYAGARDILNMDPRPQGGAALRPGLAFYGRLRNVLADIDLAGATVTAGAQVTGGGSPGDPGETPPPSDPDPYPTLPPGWTPELPPGWTPPIIDPFGLYN
jgi:hypothetical protein